jgi:hypothetical protein
MSYNLLHWETARAASTSFWGQSTVQCLPAFLLQPCLLLPSLVCLNTIIAAAHGRGRCVAAEALRQAENDSQAALDVLGDPVRHGALQLGLIAQQVRTLSKQSNAVCPWLALRTGSKISMYL